MLNVKPYSRAGSLPQGECVQSGVVVDGAGADDGSGAGRHFGRRWRQFFLHAIDTTTAGAGTTALGLLLCLLVLLPLAIPASGLVGHTDIDLAHALLRE